MKKVKWILFWIAVYCFLHEMGWAQQNFGSPQVVVIKQGAGYQILDIWNPQAGRYQRFYRNIYRYRAYVTFDKIAQDTGIPITQLRKWAFENRKDKLWRGEFTPLQELWRPLSNHGIYAVFYHSSEKVSEGGYSPFATPPVVPKQDYKEFMNVWNISNAPNSEARVQFGEVLKWMAFKVKKGLKVYPNCYALYFHPGGTFSIIDELPSLEWSGTEFGIMVDCGNTYRRYIKPEKKVLAPPPVEKPKVVEPEPEKVEKEVEEVEEAGEEFKELEKRKPSGRGIPEIYFTTGTADGNFSYKRDYYYGLHFRAPISKDSDWWFSTHAQYFKTKQYSFGPWQQWRLDIGFLYWPSFSFMTELTVGKEYDDIAREWGAWSYTSVTGFSVLRNNWAEAIFNYRAKPVDWTWWRVRDKHILFNLDGWAVSLGGQHVWSGQVNWQDIGETIYFQLNGLFLSFEKWLNQPNEPNPKFGFFAGYNWGSSERFNGWFVEMYYKL